MHLIAFVCLCVHLWVRPKNVHSHAYQSNFFTKRMHCLSTYMSPKMFARSIELYRVCYSINTIFLVGFLRNIMIKISPSLEIATPTIWINRKANPYVTAVHIAVLKSLYNTVLWQCSACTGYVFCETIVWLSLYGCVKQVAKVERERRQREYISEKRQLKPSDITLSKWTSV